MSSYSNGLSDRLVPLHPKPSSVHSMSYGTTSLYQSNSVQDLSFNSALGASKSSSSNLNAASCVRCRHRKAKCDRKSPCGTCSQAGAECLPSIPSRAPRGRQGGRKKQKTDQRLLERIAKLEGLVKRFEGQGGHGEFQQGPVMAGAGSTSDLTIKNDSPSSTTLSDDFDDPKQRLIGIKKVDGVEINRNSSPNERLDRYMGAAFWTQLSDEIHGLKDVLGSLSDDENEVESGQANLSTSTPRDMERSKYSTHSGFVLSQLPPTEAAIEPTKHQVYTFCDIYLTNIDPVFKILHAPSLRKYLQEDAKELDCSPGPGGLESLRFAIYHAATVSLEEEECKSRIGEDKAVLLARYRAGIEQALAKADFVNTTEMSTLQALMIYLVTARTYDNSRLMWTLTSLAVRIAQAMGMQYDNTSSSLRPLIREMRRRLWWQLWAIDSHFAEDRASSPIISADSFNTRMPLQVNDGDLHIDSVEEPKEADGFTDMTFCLICHEVSDSVGQLNNVPARELGLPRAASRERWDQRVGMVSSVMRRIEEKYTRHLNLARPFHWATRMVSDIINAGLWLYVYRPLQTHPGSTPRIGFGDPGILHLAVDVLERSAQIIHDPAASSFRWLSQTYVAWHALAVAIAELCVKTEGPMVERAWSIVEPMFKRTEQHIADSNKGMLWRPIKKLMNRAQALRRKQFNSPAQMPGSLASVTTSNPSYGGEIPNTQFNEFIQSNVDSFGDPMAVTQPDLNLQTSMPFDWDPWLAAADNTTTIQGLNTNDANEMAWTNWEDFVNDFQGHADMSPEANKRSPDDQFARC